MNKQLKNIIEYCEFEDKGPYLDLGTGNGYVAFEMAKQKKNITVYGLDIAEKSIEKNIGIAKSNGIKNIRFKRYDGGKFPFAGKMFNGCLSRYALHHFPDINFSIKEIKRILKANGYFFLSDPLTFDEDKTGFIDEFQSLLPDGHIHFYGRNEIENLFAGEKFYIEKEFYSSVRYPREAGPLYLELLDRTPKEILEKYEISEENGKIFVTVGVMNIFFRRG